MIDKPALSIPVMLGNSAHRRVVLGFASADLLHSLSFADVLDEDSGRGYQRRCSKKHSLDFRRYIKGDGSTTIPLTFNLRPQAEPLWQLVQHEGQWLLQFSMRSGRVLAQVDCQHRIEHLSGVDVLLPFMAYVGLSEHEEMEIFNVINSKARGLNSSLLDFHDAQLASNLSKERPELYIALQLNDDEESPWYKQLSLGGNSTSGMTRRASLRTMQKAVRRFLCQTNILSEASAPDVAVLVRDFWIATSRVLRSEWAEPRRHFLTKGIGVYALMGVLADIYLKNGLSRSALTRRHLESSLADYVQGIDWASSGTFKGLGGESGASEALELLIRQQTRNAGSKSGLAVAQGIKH